MKYIEIKSVEYCPYRYYGFDDPSDNFSMDYLCNHPEKQSIYCDKYKIPKNCPLKEIENERI